MVMPASWSGATRTTWGLGSQVPGGNLRPRPQLRVGVVWGGPGRCWRVKTFQGLTRPPDRKSAATIDRMPAHRMVAGGHPEVSSLTVGMHHPRGRRGVRNRAGHTFLFQARETRVRAPSPLPVMPDLFRHPPRGRGQAAGWIPACAGMTEQRANHRIEGSDYGTQRLRGHYT